MFPGHSDSSGCWGSLKPEGIRKMGHYCLLVGWRWAIKWLPAPSLQWVKEAALSQMSPLTGPWAAVLSYPAAQAAVPETTRIWQPVWQLSECPSGPLSSWASQEAMESPGFTPVTLFSPEPDFQHHTCFGLTSRPTHHSFSPRRESLMERAWRHRARGCPRKTSFLQYPL